MILDQQFGFREQCCGIEQVHQVMLTINKDREEKRCGTRGYTLSKKRISDFYQIMKLCHTIRQFMVQHVEEIATPLPTKYSVPQKNFIQRICPPIKIIQLSKEKNCLGWHQTLI